MAAPVKLRVILGENNSQRLFLPDGIPQSTDGLSQEIRAVWNRGTLQASIHGHRLWELIQQLAHNVWCPGQRNHEGYLKFRSPFSVWWKSTSSRSSAWPVGFQISRFSYDAELQLDKASAAFKETGTSLNPDSKQKFSILNSLVEIII